MNDKLFFIYNRLYHFMKRLSDTLLARWLLLMIVVILVLMPFHAAITVWLSSIFGHYTAIRLWKEVFLLVGLVLCAALFYRDKHTREKILNHPLLKPVFILIGLYIGLHILVGGVALLRDDVVLKALGYGFVSNLRFLLFFGMCIVAAHYNSTWIRRYWWQLLLWPAAVVVVFGLLQTFILPVDFLKHAGYGSDTIAPYIAVDQKVEYARVQSTLRGPNPLGAYLVIIVTALAGLFLSVRLKSWKFPVALLATLTVLYGTYSRSAYIGTFLSVLLLVWLMARSVYVRKLLLVTAAVTVVIGAGMLFVLRDNDRVQNVLFHTDEHSLSSSSSNDSRAGVMKQGVRDIAEQPLGRGPGTAGPASVYNNGHARVAENYFVQIAQEVGVVGVVLFLGICFFAGRALWYMREWGVLPLVLLTSLVGLTVINLMSHAWADDTLAYIWWGFTGLVIGAALFEKQKGTHGKKAV
jgi:hypothetical protein